MYFPTSFNKNECTFRIFVSPKKNFYLNNESDERVLWKKVEKIFRI
jgi:hypothetical protein